MKAILAVILIFFCIGLLCTFYFLDKEYFLCPIEYHGDIIIRNDARGEGSFASPRNGNRIHEGIDLFAKVATDVLASRSGKVLAATSNKGMGKYVVIRHRGGIKTIYGHLSEIKVRKGQFVRQGQLLGRVGKTGNANYRDIQPHLHFEIKKDGIPQDPLEYLP
jgi:murein DD-endopeptidase MepM/ murein hydrolase activator NlpD